MICVSLVAIAHCCHRLVVRVMFLALGKSKVVHLTSYSGCFWGRFVRAMGISGISWSLVVRFLLAETEFEVLRASSLRLGCRFLMFGVSRFGRAFVVKMRFSMSKSEVEVWKASCCYFMRKVRFVNWVRIVDSVRIVNREMIRDSVNRFVVRQVRGTPVAMWFLFAQTKIEILETLCWRFLVGESSIAEAKCHCNQNCDCLKNEKRGETIYINVIFYKVTT